MILKDSIEKVMEACKKVEEMATPEERENDKKNARLFATYGFFTVALIIVTYFVGEYILIPLIPVIVLIVLARWEKNSSSIQVPQITYPEVNVLSEMLCKILSEHAEILEVVRPVSIADIVPTNYPVCQTVDNLPFYRFIIMRKSDSTVSLKDMEESLYQFMAQHLTSSLCPNLPYRYYNDIPYFTVFNVGTDYFHRNFLYIDVMPVKSDACYNFILNKRYADNYKAKNSAQPSPSDEEF